MLVLSRKVNEGIVFPELGIRVVVVEVRGGNSVKLGIEADKRHTILREELMPETGKAVRTQSDSPVHVDITDTSASHIG